METNMKDLFNSCGIAGESEEGSPNEDLRQETDEKLCDNAAFGKFLNAFATCDYGAELNRRIREYPFERIMNMCKYVGMSMKMSDIYFYVAKDIINGLILRPDGQEIMSRFEREGGFEVIGMSEHKKTFMQILQKNSTN